jgi:hypothetical protein
MGISSKTKLSQHVGEESIANKVVLGGFFRLIDHFSKDVIVDDKQMTLSAETFQEGASGGSSLSLKLTFGMNSASISVWNTIPCKPSERKQAIAATMKTNDEMIQESVQSLWDALKDWENSLNKK